MEGSIRYINFSGYYDKFDEWKEKTKAIARHKGILKCLTKEWEIPKEEDADYAPYLLNIYEGNNKAWYLLITSLKDIPFGLSMQCNDN